VNSEGEIWGELGSPIGLPDFSRRFSPPATTGEFPYAGQSRSRGEVWSKPEVEAVVSDYFRMLRLELSGQTYNKSEHRRQLQKLLNNRPAGSVERKHQNISAILLELGIMRISGYKPLNNYQRILAEQVAIALDLDSTLDKVALEAVSKHAEIPRLGSLEDFVTPVPRFEPRVREVTVPWDQKIPIRRDYLEREARNSALGSAGEHLAVEYERRRLIEHGKRRLAERVEHCSKSRGDGLGFDILSFEPSGREKFIEVKTTAFGPYTPFFVSESERKFSVEHGEQFHLYRLYEFREQPRMYALEGAITQTCSLDPTNYRALPFGR
jgi:hypothetical protein